MTLNPVNAVEMLSLLGLAAVLLVGALVGLDVRGHENKTVFVGLPPIWPTSI